MVTDILARATLPRPKYRYSVDEYLAIEQVSDLKHAYYAGEIVAMVGASPAHVLIVTNLVVSLGIQLRDRDFLVFSTDLRVKVDESGFYTYPDVCVVAGEGEFEERGPKTLLNPAVLIEVLSPSTEEYDRQGKFEHYQLLSTLRHYVLISQDERRIEMRTRLNDGSWTTSVAFDSNRSMTLDAIDCVLPFDDIYHKVPLSSRE